MVAAPEVLGFTPLELDGNTVGDPSMFRTAACCADNACNGPPGPIRRGLMSALTCAGRAGEDLLDCSTSPSRTGLVTGEEGLSCFDDTIGEEAVVVRSVMDLPCNR